MPCEERPWYADLDGDGLGAGEVVWACSAPASHVANADDCDDGCPTCDGRPEICDGLDNDCDGAPDELLFETCGLDVGICVPGTRQCSAGEWGACQGGVSPRAEVCDGFTDENCDGEIDEGCECIPGDIEACGTDEGECMAGTRRCDGTGHFGDCEGDVGPVDETCDGLDNDCDGTADNGNPEGGATCGSNTGECTAGTIRCALGDLICDGEIPPVEETCNGRDDDCDGVTDNGVLTTYYRDLDGDGHGIPDVTIEACTLPGGYAAVADDCNDACATCSPSGTEVCDELDNDCNGEVDEGVELPFYVDADGDGHGFPETVLYACEAPEGYGPSDDECDDSCPECFASAAEQCDGLDNDCDGQPDDGFVCVQGSTVPCTTTCGTSGTGACDASCRTPAPRECDPPAEICDGADQDCDGMYDEGTRVFRSPEGLGLGTDASLEPMPGGFLGVTLRNGLAKIFTTDDTGAVVYTPTTITSEAVEGIDMSQASPERWHVAIVEGAAIDVRQVVAPSGVPSLTGTSKGIVDDGDDRVARIASRNDSDALVILSSGGLVKIARVLFEEPGLLYVPTAVPTSNARGEFGVAATALYGGQGYAISWVAGNTPTVYAGIVIDGTTVTNIVSLGAGTNPTMRLNPSSGLLGVAYRGADGRPRLHVLRPDLTCVWTEAAASSCGATLSDRVVNPQTPQEGRVMELGYRDGAFELAARVAGAELFARAYVHNVDPVPQVWDEVAAEVGDSVSTWVSLGSSETATVFVRGVISFSMFPVGCPAPE